MAEKQKKTEKQTVSTPVVVARIDRLLDGEYKTKAFASVTIGGAFAVHGIRVIETDKGRFIAMPQESYQKHGETKYNDLFHAITADARTAVLDAVEKAYEQALGQQMAEPEQEETFGMEQVM